MFPVSNIKHILIASIASSFTCDTRVVAHYRSLVKGGTAVYACEGVAASTLPEMLL
jgi:hypothetical protein